MNEIDNWINASLEDIIPFCSTSELSGLKHRLNSNCTKEFSRGISELVVSSHYAQNKSEGLQIPRGSKQDKDIDVSFSHAGTRINIEVKCPDLSSNTTKEFTLHLPFVHRDFDEGKELERNLAKKMGGNLNIIPNKILNFEDFLVDCEKKFQQSAETTDVNIVVFSMLALEWMDDYRIKIEDENMLRNHAFIDVVVLSNAAMLHSKSVGHHAFGFSNCFNYLIFNNDSRNKITLEKKRDYVLHSKSNH